MMVKNKLTRLIEKIVSSLKPEVSLSWLGKMLMSVSILMALVVWIPQVVYMISPTSVSALAGFLRQGDPVDKSEFGAITYEEPENVYQPAFDPRLPEENRLIVDKIGINTQIGEGSYEEALKNGVWRATDLGTPYKRNKPTILAAHRFGYLAWSNQYRRENSFFNLPKLSEGDKITIIWNQREYVYEIYDGYTDTKIRNYDTDLILYTCEVLNSPRRVVRLARLIEDNSKDSVGFGVVLSSR